MNITDALLTPNKYSRPQIPLKTVKKVVLHYVGNAGSTAIATRNYFENQKNGGRYVSSHYIVGLDGEILRCVPENEVAYCSNQANTYSISIECCHPDAMTGKFTNATTESAIDLCAYLLKKYGLATTDLIRHYDVTGKQCPLWFSPTKYQPAEVANARWAAFKLKVAQKMGADDEPEAHTVPFKVRVLDDALNVRKTAGVSAPIAGVISDHGVYTIIETKTVGTSEWGKLKSGLGWINVGAKYVQRI
ncbi:MAG: N-acetylmuramoyl-L-alanine amidase family protein [Oscillospiraceae bacterium]